MQTKTNGRTLCASDLQDIDVVNAKNEDIGTVEDLVIDRRTGRVDYAILSMGGFLGMGEKRHAVPFQALQSDPKNDRFVLDTPKDRLEKAPAFDPNDRPDFADEEWSRSVNRHWGTTRTS